MNSFLNRTVVSAAALLALACGVAQAAPQSLQTEGTGEVTVTSGNSARIVNDSGEYGLVITNSNLRKLVKGKPSSRPIGSVDYSFQSSGTVAGGAPRFSIPIDINGDGAEDGFAFMDVNGCFGATTVSTKSPTCQVFFTTEVFPNWAAFVAAHPTYNALGWAFIIADQAGDYTITNIDVK